MPHPSEWRQHFICFSRRRRFFFLRSTLKLRAHFSRPTTKYSHDAPNQGERITKFFRFEAAEEEALSPEAQIHFGTHLSPPPCGLLICPSVHTRCSQSTHRDLVCLTDGCFCFVQREKKRENKSGLSRQTSRLTCVCRSGLICRTWNG